MLELKSMGKPIKIVVQNVETSFYFKVGDVWTASPEHARSFETAEKALQFCAERKLDRTRFKVLTRIPEQAPPPRPPSKLSWNGRRIPG